MPGLRGLLKNNDRARSARSLGNLRSTTRQGRRRGLQNVKKAM